VNIKVFNKNFVVFYSFIAVTFILSLMLINLPLVGSFGYEFSVFFALLFFIFGGILNIYSTNKKISEKNYFLFALTIVATPLITILFASFFKPICSFWFGLSFYTTLSVISFLISYFLSEIVQSVFQRYTKTIFLISVFLICLIPVTEIYFNPQIYFYSPVIGFFPGTIYDEDVSVTSTLLFYRGLNLLYFGLLFVVIKRKLIKNKIFFASLALMVAVIFILLSSQLGFSTTQNRLDNILPSKAETKNFIIKYDVAKVDTNEIKNLILSHEFYFEKLKTVLKFNPDRKIISYIFNDKNQKKIYFGSEQADVAKPWLYEIYLSRDSWNKSLKHEMLHIFSAEIGNGIFKLAASFNPALIEGFPEAIDNNFDDIELHTLSASAFHFGYRINIEELFSGLNFFKSFSGLSYLYAGSFSKFLIDNYGPEAFTIFYKTKEAEKAFGKSLSKLSEDYYEFLRNYKISFSKEQVEYYFGRASIFQKVCPRQIATELKKAEKFLSIENYSEAEKIYKEILKATTNYLAVSGLAHIYYERKHYNKAMNLLNQYLNDFRGTPYFYNLKLSVGDFYSLVGDTKSALTNYNDLIESKPHINLKALAELRLELNKNGYLKNYLKSTDSAKFQILVKLNKQKPVLSSLISMISLAEQLNIHSDIILDSFYSPLNPTNDEEAYFVYQLSKYLLNKFDITNARKLASLSLRKSFNSIYYISIKEHFEKCNWFVKNYDFFFNQTLNR
jgi:tetratricopeptide (TPR) repeat protein